MTKEEKPKKDLHDDEQNEDSQAEQLMDEQYEFGLNEDVREELEEENKDGGSHKEHEDQSTLIVKCTKEEAMNIVQDVKRNNAKLVVERNPQKVITNINDVHILKMKFIQEKLDNNNTAEEQKTELNSIDFVQKDEYALETLESDNEAHSKVEVYKLPLVNEDKEVSSLQEDKPLQEIYDRYLKSDKVLTLKEIQRLISICVGKAGLGCG